LAIIDTHFPWRISGFRFFEFRKVLLSRPDTVFFSLYTSDEPFDVPVHPLADFPVLAPALGVTDVYAVFLDFTVGVLGITGQFPIPSSRPDISLVPTLRIHGMRFHCHIYPGGGLTPETDPAVHEALVNTADTVFTNAPEADVRGVHILTPGVLDESFWGRRSRPERPQLHLLFVGDDHPRKGFATLVEAFNRLDDGYQLHIVGPQERHLPEFTNRNFTYYGWLQPKDLREVCDRADVIVAPLTVDREGEIGAARIGMVDGFPTTAALQAMATGCCLVAANPRHDTSVFTPGRDYVEIGERDAHSLVDAVEGLRADRNRMHRIAEQGAAIARDAFSVERGVEARLRMMGLTPKLEGTARPDDARLLHRAGVHLLNAGEAAWAQVALAAALREASGPDLLNHAAIATHMAGDSDIAVALLQAALFADPGDPSARQSLTDLTS
jgi:glycosyltransferase involved in cell wall biosynthesis